MALDLIPGKKIFTQRDVRETANIGLTPAIVDFTTAQHAHTGAPSGGLIAHGSLSNIGTNTHAQVDAHIANTANPHSVVLADLATAGEGIDFSGTDILGENASDSNKGIASFQLTDFTVTSGDVFLKDDIARTIDGDTGTATAVAHNFDILGGTGIVTAGASNDITITNAGVTSNVAGTGIGVSAGTGAVTITNTGVTSAVAGEGIDVSAATGAVTISCEDSTSGNKGVVIVAPGEGIDVTYASGTATIDAEVATSTNLGVALFNTTDFTVTAGSVAINNERICDDVGAMVTGNTETNIAVTYQDADNTLDFVVATATDSVLGVASFSSADFTVATGAVSLKNKTSYLSIPGTAFQGESIVDHNYSSGNGKFNSNGTMGNGAQAPVMLPHGSVVTAITVWGSDAAEAYYLYYAGITGDGADYGTMATANINTADTSIANATIDNNTYRYWIQTSGLDSSDDIYGARITYTTDYD